MYASEHVSYDARRERGLIVVVASCVRKGTRTVICYVYVG